MIKLLSDLRVSLDISREKLKSFGRKAPWVFPTDLRNWDIYYIDDNNREINSEYNSYQFSSYFSIDARDLNELQLEIVHGEGLETIPYNYLSIHTGRRTKEDDYCGVFISVLYTGNKSYIIKPGDHIATIKFYHGNWRVTPDIVSINYSKELLKNEN